MKLPIFTALIIGMSAAAHADWPAWRGADGLGHSSSEALPVEWDQKKNVTWRTELPGRGWSSPVVADGVAWITTAHEVEASEAEKKERLKANTGGQPVTVLAKAAFHALAVDVESGKLLHDIKLFEVKDPQWVHRFNSYASPTAVIDKGRVYCHFGTFGTACVDAANGKIVWKNLELHCMHENGPGGSPVVAGENLIFHLDGSDVQYVAALNKATGKLAWKTNRSGKLHENPQLKKAYGTPLLYDGIIYSPGANWLYGYEPKTGKELWKLDYETLGFSNVSRPVIADGMAFVPTCFMRSQMLGVRLGAQPEVVWRHKKGVPSSPSPIHVEGLLYFASDSGGLVSCLEAKTGELIWSERIASGKYWAAPLHANGRLYFHSEEGVTTVLKTGRKFEILASNDLDEKLMASAAVVGDSLLLRTEKALYRIEVPAK